MARFGSVGMGVLLTALVAGASAWLIGCEPSRSSSSSKESASQADKTRKDESINGAGRGSGAVTAPPAPSRTEETAKLEPSGDEGSPKSDSPKGEGKENKDEDGEFVVRDAKTGQVVRDFKIRKLDPNQKPAVQPNPIPPPDLNPSSIEGLKAVTTESGLKYWDIKVGTGDTVESTSDVKTHFTGWKKDGKMFTTTEFTKRPRHFALWSSRVIGGLRYGLPGMRVGGKRRLEVSPELAGGSAFPDDSTLILEVEVLETATRPSLPTPSSVFVLKPKTTASGLTFWDIVQGTGATPEPTSMVSVYFTLWLEDGAINTTSEFSGGPMRYPLNKLFEGFRETLGTMKVGGIRQAKVPPNLAYGEAGQPPEIPPNATLILEVQLVEVE